MRERCAPVLTLLSGRAVILREEYGERVDIARAFARKLSDKGSFVEVDADGDPIVVIPARVEAVVICRVES